MSVSLAVICFFPLVNAGMRSTAPLVASSSSTKKPRSANTQSSWVSLSRKPDFRVISLSEALPPQPAERKLTAPAGVIPIRYLIVLWDLQFENVCAVAFKLRGHLVYISVQSMMQTQFLKEVKHRQVFLQCFCLRPDYYSKNIGKLW